MKYRNTSDIASSTFYLKPFNDTKFTVVNDDVEMTLPDGATDYIPPNKVNPDYDCGASGSGGSGGATGFFDFISGLISSIKDFVVTLVKSVTAIFDEFKNFGDGFSSFLASTFSFIPKPLLSLIILSFSLSINC